MKIINSKIFKIIVGLFILGFILGIILFYKLKVNDQIYSYFNNIKNNNFNYFENLTSSSIYNIKYIILIWVSGIAIFLTVLIPFIIIFRGILNGFIFISLIHMFHLKGLLIALILLFPTVLIYELSYFFISYYSLNFSIRTFNTIKNNKEVNLRQYVKNYFYQFLIFFIVLIFNSFFETFITSNIIRYVL